MEMDKGFQRFREEKEYKLSWEGRADSRIRNAFKACEKAKEAILRKGEFDEERVEIIEKNLEYIVNHDLFDPTPREIDCLFGVFYDALDEERGDRILLTGKLDQVGFELDEADRLLKFMFVWSGSRARSGEDPEK